MWKDSIELGNLTESIVKGEAVKTITYRQVFANKKSVRQSEFYQAANVGLKPELVFEVHTFDFASDEMVRYNSKEYSIIRTYEVGDITELTVSAYIGSV